ncbi:MAG: D-alanine--D-alanine ligase [Planctomycetes bacterium]|nr:D-alanine--D-alanine ligase [Planctomycetota bacterium]
MKKLRVAVLMHQDLVPPEKVDDQDAKNAAPWRTEYDVLATLHNMAHEAWPVGIGDTLDPLRKTLDEQKPHIVFNLLEEFRGSRVYAPYVLGYLDLIGQAYTGCNPRGMILSHSKALANRILRSHRVRVPDFGLFERDRRIRRPRRLAFPLLVKSATEHGSVGISQASIVHDDDQLRERVELVHAQLGTDAVAEQYIEGREFYVGVIGNRRLDTFPIWELTFENLPDNAPNIATAKVKWDFQYQKARGVMTREAKDLPPQLRSHILRTCRRAYRALGQSGYARMDFRQSSDGEIYLLECNHNPQLAYGEDFAESAEAGGINYQRLLQRILNLGLRYRGEPVE